MSRKSTTTSTSNEPCRLTCCSFPPSTKPACGAVLSQWGRRTPRCRTSQSRWTPRQFSSQPPLKSTAACGLISRMARWSLRRRQRLLGSINDMWYRWVADVGLVGADKGNGGKYLILPPGYSGLIPSGYFVVQPQTYNNWLFWRSVPTKQYPQPSPDLVKQYTRIYPLSGANPPPMNFVDMSGKPWDTVAPADYTAWETLNQIVQQEPTSSLDSLRLGYFASIGIVKGEPFAPDDRMKAILTEAAAVGDATARAITYKIRGGQEDYFYRNSAWRIPLPGGYQFQEQPGVLSLDDYISYFFLATGVTPSMVGAGSAQAWACLDSNGNPFDGGKNYKLHLPPNIPIKQDWSVVVYDNQTRSMLQTDQEYPFVGSTTPGLQVNPDGSVDVYFGPTAPRAWRTTGFRQSQAKAGTQSYDSTSPPNPGSTKRGGPAK